ncbi:unnamed protein product [Paramecium octaurelia]|uniref:Uncharacterized protein n=1 Tax=Paramecium octaurelia TaxID=43137 RepID=A0A8S1TKS5_PAROT|nr:unnamed protein product [Paramecium octaurelia]
MKQFELQIQKELNVGIGEEQNQIKYQMKLFQCLISCCLQLSIENQEKQLRDSKLRIKAINKLDHINQQIGSQSAIAQKSYRKNLKKQITFQLCLISTFVNEIKICYSSKKK